MQLDSGDDILVERAKGGDRTAFGDLVARHYALIHRLSFRLLGSEAEADDLAQDICADLPRKLQSFRGEARFTTWLHRLVINAGRDALRRHARRDRAAKSWGELEQLRQAETSETRRQLEWLHEAMSALSPDLRETVALVLGEEMTHAAAAECLGVSEGTVSWRMNAVRKTLREHARAEDLMP